TPRGAEILRHARLIANQADAIAALGATGDVALTTYRIATLDVVASEILAPSLASLLAAHPSLRVQLQVSADTINFSRWEADIAVRLSEPERGDFLVSRVGELAMVFVEPKGISEDQMVACAFPEGFKASPETAFLDALGHKEGARCLTTSFATVKALVMAGGACGVLPAIMCGAFVARGDRVTPLPEARQAYLLLQPHLKFDAEARHLVNWIRLAFAVATRDSEVARA
ncbi:MAG: LysR family transcriptional regulator, partial [Pseudomonadota bacterium]